jgi:hypothetical protein
MKAVRIAGWTSREKFISNPRVLNLVREQRTASLEGRELARKVGVNVELLLPDARTDRGFHFTRRAFLTHALPCVVHREVSTFTHSIPPMALPQQLRGRYARKPS